ncbi:MAG TPA: hypothetical protein VNI54_03790, partial [Thermoanaerobaculia bacterium]|nr:hypothetical protein [Thermoanaerobaculia bacterium]
MSILEGSVKTKSAATEAVELWTPEQVVEQLRVLRGHIPEFVQLPRDRKLLEMRRLASVDLEFARESFNAVAASNVVQGVVGSSREELHAAEDEIARWTIVESEMRSILGGVAAANLVRRHRLGEAALQVFKVSKQLVRLQEHADLLPHVERLRRMNRFARRR